MTYNKTTCEYDDQKTERAYQYDQSGKIYVMESHWSNGNMYSYDNSEFFYTNGLLTSVVVTGETDSGKNPATRYVISH